VRRRPPPWPLRAILARMPRPAGASAGGEFFGTYLARLPDLRDSPPLGSGRPDRVFSHPGWSPGASCCWRQDGFFVRAGCTGGVRHRSLTSLDPVRVPGLTRGFLVAGPGFEPGKTVVGDFTDAARYRPDLGEHQSNPPFWHVFDTTTRHAPYSPLRAHSPNRPAARADPHAVG
jgi:hypothetical protein